LIKTIIYFTNKKARIAQFNLNKQSIKIIKDKSIVLENNEINPLAIKGLVTKQGFAKSDLVGCLFRHQVSVRFFSFPSHEDGEIGRMAQYEAAELLPLKPEETITRYIVLKKRNNGYADTMVVVTHKEEVAKLLDKVKASAMTIESLNLSSLALLRCLNHVIGKKLPESNDNVLLVYVEDGAVEIIIARNEIIEFSRGFVTEDINKSTQVLISEIRHSMELFFNNADENKLTRIILGSPRADLKPIAEVLKQRFSVPLQEEKIDIAYGLAALGDEGVNLLSNEFIRSRKAREFKNKILIAGGLLLVNILLFAGIFMIQINRKQAYLEKLNKEIIARKPLAQAVQNKLRKLTIVQTQLSSQLLVLDAITDIVDITPVSASLNMLSVNEQGDMVIRGQAKTLQEVLDFVSAIEKSEYFVNSHLNYSNRRKLRDMELIDFEIQAKLQQS
jgi:Tfp pilus assembly PilM family ATPase